MNGKANIIYEDGEVVLGTNESILITDSKEHRVENSGSIDLVMIEIQSPNTLKAQSP